MKPNLGTRFTTGCGHSWKRSPARWTIADVAGATIDCPFCDELLIIPHEQFDGRDRDVYPIAVHCPRFHNWLNAQDPSWPVDGNGTFYTEISMGDDEE